MNYYDIQDIELNESLIPLKFKYTILQPPYYIKKNKTYHLPLYLTRFALENEHCFLAKKFLSENEKSELEIEPKMFNARKKSKYFFRLVKHAYNEKNLASEVFVERMRNFSEKIYKEFFEEDDVKILDDIEKKIICKSRSMFKKFNT